jgi:hypothetical membrane protein
LNPPLVVDRDVREVVPGTALCVHESGRMISMRVASALAGTLGPIVFLTVLTLAGLVRPGYDPVTSYASDLAVGETSWLQTANFIVFGCLVILFAVGLGRGLAGGRALRVSAMLLALAGLGLIIAGVFPTDLIGQPSTTHGAMHFVASILMFGTLNAAFFVIVVPLRQDERWAGYARYSTITGVIAGGLCLASVAAALPATFNNFQAGPLAAWTGLVQRALFVVAFGWIAMVGFRLLRVSCGVALPMLERWPRPLVRQSSSVGSRSASATTSRSIT